ncbi:hypothetical protein J6590_029964 [Homalodisca vitripennis]|nr:hypothetical protein J6590_029964 [Homalodisca vitripennis]
MGSPSERDHEASSESENELGLIKQERDVKQSRDHQTSGIMKQEFDHRTNAGSPKVTIFLALICMSHLLKWKY